MLGYELYDRINYIYDEDLRVNGNKWFDVKFKMEWCVVVNHLFRDGTKNTVVRFHLNLVVM